MDRIDKFLRKATNRERAVVARTIDALYSGNTKRLDIKKLQGYPNVYRVRVGTIRIIFRNTDDDLVILQISRRNEKTYKGTA